MKRLVLSLAVVGTALALAAGVALAQATTERGSLLEPADMVLENPCTGELVHFTGNFRILFHFTEDANGGLHFHSSLQPRRILGTGLESGTRYRLVGVSREERYFSPGEHFENTSVGRFHIVSNSSSDNWLQDFTFHVTINPNGEVTAEIDRFRSRCVG